MTVWDKPECSDQRGACLISEVALYKYFKIGLQALSCSQDIVYEKASSCHIGGACDKPHQREHSAVCSNVPGALQCMLCRKD